MDELLQKNTVYLQWRYFKKRHFKKKLADDMQNSVVLGF